MIDALNLPAKLSTDPDEYAAQAWIESIVYSDHPENVWDLASDIELNFPETITPEMFGQMAESEGKLETKLALRMADYRPHQLNWIKNE